MTMCSLSICQYYRHPYCHTSHLHRFLLTRLVGMQQGYKHTFNNLRWVSYFSRSVIIIIYFPWNVISKKGNRSKCPHFLPKRPYFFSKINYYKRNILCDSNVYKCHPAIRFCSNILFLFYYIFINLFIKIINLINDDCSKLNLYVSLIITIIICLYRCRWSLMSLVTM